MRNHFLRAKKRGVATVVGQSSTIPTAGRITFGSGETPDAKAGDLAIVYCYDPDAYFTFPTVSGWTRRAYDDTNADGSCAIYSSILTSSDALFDIAAGDTDGEALLVVFRLVTWGGINVSLSSEGHPSPPTVPGCLIGDLVVAIGSWESATYLTPPTGYTNVMTRSNGISTSSTSMMAVRTATTNGSITPGGFGGDGGTTSDGKAWTIRLALI